eukprot:scaffold16470_cov61-Cyclotella_meneghiniana.AAC.11
MKVIGYPPIASDPSWNASNITLGDAVYAVIHHFQLNPPNVMEIVDVNLKRLQESLSSGGGTKNNSSAAAAMRASSQQSVNGSSSLQNGSTNEKQSQRQHEVVTDDEVNTLIPSIPATFPQLQSMTMSEIKHLLNNESALESFIQRTPEVITLNEIKQSIVDANVGTAQSNILQYKEKVDRQFFDITTLEKELSSKLSIYEKLNNDVERICRPPDGKDAVKELNRAKKEAYRNSETIADDWVESGDNIHEFVKKFMEERILYHTRAAKAERLSL